MEQGSSRTSLIGGLILERGPLPTLCIRFNKFS
ncbi:hypothetical protein CFBP6411_03603 [Pseudomonas syringae group genomosp. 3]|uniref:Uncharacterized protein n=1 Tax=Pseudomonas syringae group genomosp. 3 TaxID=251701 RepID=A0A2K4WGE1_9PSED|nr:hypothetical protein CFBP6411_03603 [Pseudomonas syringae group genomosp. 3]